MKNRLALVCGAFALVTLVSVPLLADPCLVVYPDGPCYYHYDVNEYYTVTFGDPLYDPLYDRGGEVLIEVGTNDIDLSIYQAPNLLGFEPSTNGEEGYFLIGNDFDLIVDGWSNNPTTYTNILLVFEPDPSYCVPMITVDGNSTSFHPTLGFYYAIGDLVVSTPVGSHYSDTVMYSIHWELCAGVRVWAFADEDHNFNRDGGECFTAFSHDVTIPVKEKSWGAIKARYKD